MMMKRMKDQINRFRLVHQLFLENAKLMKLATLNHLL